MHGLYIEERPLSGDISLSWDLVHHLYARGRQPRVAVITEKPAIMLAATRKQWFRLTRQVQRQRSSTLRASRIIELSNQLSWMQRLCFTSKDPAAALTADVLFATTETFLKTPPACTTLYATCHVTASQLEILTSNMPENSVAVLYPDAFLA